MFQKQDRRTKRPPQRALDRVWLQTRPSATDVPGLCRRDTVVVEFQKVNQSDEGPDASVRAAGLKSTSYFTFLKEPTGEYEEIERHHPVSVSECSQLADDQRLFSAADEQAATDGYRAFLALRAALARGTKVPLDCDLFPVDQDSCSEIIMRMDAADLNSVRDCASEPGTSCTKVQIDDRDISIVRKGYVPSGPLPDQVVRAKLSSLIVLADEIAD